MINDTQSLVSAQFKSGTPIATYDGGFGPLWILRNSMGVQGIIRAQNWLLTSAFNSTSKPTNNSHETNKP